MQTIAARQWEIVTVEDLAGAGLTAHEVRGMVARGQLRRLYRGVYATGRARLPVNGLLLAAQLACGPGAYLTRRTALAYARVCGQYLGRIEVAVPGNAVRPRPAPVAVRATTVPATTAELRVHAPADRDRAAGAAGPRGRRKR